VAVSKRTAAGRRGQRTTNESDDLQHHTPGTLRETHVAAHLHGNSVVVDVGVEHARHGDGSRVLLLIQGRDEHLLVCEVHCVCDGDRRCKLRQPQTALRLKVHARRFSVCTLRSNGYGKQDNAASLWQSGHPTAEARPSHLQRTARCPTPRRPSKASCRASPAGTGPPAAPAPPPQSPEVWKPLLSLLRRSQRRRRRLQLRMTTASPAQAPARRSCAAPLGRLPSRRRPCCTCFHRRTCTCPANENACNTSQIEQSSRCGRERAFVYLTPSSSKKWHSSPDSAALSCRVPPRSCT